MGATFADVLPVTKVSSHEYTVTFENAWVIGSVPNGGYVTSAFQLVARTHMQTTHASQSQPDVVNLHLEFLRRTSAGLATFKVQDVKIGSRISNLHLTLCQPKDPSDPQSPIQDEVQGYVMISNIRKETGPTNVTKYRPLPLPLPVSLADLSSNSDRNYIMRRPDPYGGFRRATGNTQLHLVKPGRRTPELDNPSIVDQWIRFDPQSLANGQPKPPSGTARWTNDALGYIVDTFPQAHERYINKDLEDSLLTHPDAISTSDLRALAKNKKENSTAASFWYPTLLLNLDVKRRLPDEGVEWLFLRVQAKRMENGRFDLHIEVWDDPLHGNLIATSTHAALMVDASRNLAARGGRKKGAKI